MLQADFSAFHSHFRFVMIGPVHDIKYDSECCLHLLYGEWSSIEEQTIIKVAGTNAEEGDHGIRDVVVDRIFFGEFLLVRTFEKKLPELRGVVAVILEKVIIQNLAGRRHEGFLAYRGTDDVPQ